MPDSPRRGAGGLRASPSLSVVAKVCAVSASPTPEGLSVNSRGCARHERTPGNGGLNARHPGGVVPHPPNQGRSGAGRTPPGFWIAAAGSRGVARPSLHPRLFTGNPAGVRPWDASDRLISRRLRRPRWALVILRREAAATVRTARTFATLATVELREIFFRPASDGPRLGGVHCNERRVERVCPQRVADGAAGARVARPPWYPDRGKVADFLHSRTVNAAAARRPCSSARREHHASLNPATSE